MPLIGFTSGPELLIMILAGAIFIIPFWKIFSKAGFPGALALLTCIPLFNLIMLFFLAFAQWPALKQRAPDNPPEGPKPTES